MTTTYTVSAALGSYPPAAPVKPGCQAADLPAHLTPTTKPPLPPSPAPTVPDTILSQALAYIELFESYHQQHRGDISQLQQLVQELQEDRASQDKVIAALAADKGAQEQAAAELAVEIARQQLRVQALHNDWAELQQAVSDLLESRAGGGGQQGGEEGAGSSQQVAALQREKSALAKAQEGLQAERDGLASRWPCRLAECCMMGLLLLPWGCHVLSSMSWVFCGLVAVLLLDALSTQQHAAHSSQPSSQCTALHLACAVQQLVTHASNARHCWSSS